MAKSKLKKIESIESTEIGVFKPTPAMIVWLDSAVKTLSDSPSEIASNCETPLDRTNWYVWLKIPGFEEWYFNEYAKKRKRIIPTLDAIAMKHARKGSFPHWDALNKKVEGEVDKGYEEAGFVWRRRV